jgi:hypothetical protein
MAVIEIAKIQVRRGQENQTGLPTLAGGEFAWAADTEHLYIGLRREDGGSRDANVRILTENDERNFFNIAASSSTYIYRDASDITLNLTDPGFEVERSIQDKLDDIVNIKDFGAVPNGINDNTAVIQEAIHRLFSAWTTSSAYNLYGGIAPRKKLYFPSGVYKITDTIFIPAYTTIVGEGKGQTIINLASTGTSTHIFQTAEPNKLSTLGISGLHQGPYRNFDNAKISNTYTARNIHIEGLTLRYDTTATTVSQVASLISLDSAPNSVIRDVKFQGGYSANPYNGFLSTNSNYVGIVLRGDPMDSVSSSRTENVVIDNCEFENLYYGIKSNYDVPNIIVKNSEFLSLNKGITFNDPADNLQDLGPRFARFTDNRFRDIQREAIYTGTGTFYNNTSANHVSLNNQFINVGNNNSSTVELATSSIDRTPIITYLQRNCVSMNDYFDRFDWQLRQGTTGTYYAPLVQGHTTIDTHAVEYRTVRVGESKTLIRWPLTGRAQFLINKYQVWNDSTSTNDLVDRQGTLNIYVKKPLTPLSIPDIEYDDSYNYTNNDGSVDWTPALNTTDNTFQITLNNPWKTGNSATFIVTALPYSILSTTTWVAGTYTNITIVNGGSGYWDAASKGGTEPGDYLGIDGALLGGSSDKNSLTIEVMSTGTAGVITGVRYVSGTSSWVTITTTTVFGTSTALVSNPLRTGGAGYVLTVEYQHKLMIS